MHAEDEAAHAEVAPNVQEAQAMEGDDGYETEELLSELESDTDEEGSSEHNVKWPQFVEGRNFKDVTIEVGMQFRNL